MEYHFYKGSQLEGVFTSLKEIRAYTGKSQMTINNIFNDNYELVDKKLHSWYIDLVCDEAEYMVEIELFRKGLASTIK